MNNFSSYKVIEHFDITELQSIVTQYLQHGWELIGGIAMVVPSQNRQEVHYAQAIALRKEGA